MLIQITDRHDGILKQTTLSNPSHSRDPGNSESGSTGVRTLNQENTQAGDLQQIDYFAVDYLPQTHIDDSQAHEDEGRGGVEDWCDQGSEHSQDDEEDEEDEKEDERDEEEDGEDEEEDEDSEDVGERQEGDRDTYDYANPICEYRDFFHFQQSHSPRTL